MAGMIDTLWALGRRLTWEELQTPFGDIQLTHQYGALTEAKAAIRTLSRRIRQDGLPPALTPLICGFAGYGNVSTGAQEIYDMLPVQEIAPSELADFAQRDPHHLYKVVFKEKDMVEPVDSDSLFELQNYYDHPEKYRSRFERSEGRSWG